jgi:alcohol dehydrogenase
MISFDFQLPTRIIFGEGCVDQLGALIAELGVKRALVVSDSGVIEAGHTQHGIDSLQKAGIETSCFSGVHENPSTKDVAAGVDFAQSFQPDALVGLGGGSSMDCAKGINFLYSNGGQMKDYWGVGKATKPMLPMIAVPTTAGTGSEAQSFALISDAKTHVKMACGDKKAACRMALLDPRLTLTQPARVTALTGIDALAHALETFVTTKRSPVSMAFSREAFRLLAENFGRVLQEPDNLEARSGMQLGACFAGLAIENSMLGAAHALANPLTAAHGVIHGQAVGLMLPHVIRFNGEQFENWYQDLLVSTAGHSALPAPSSGVSGLADFVHSLVGLAGLVQRLADLGIHQTELPELAADAAKQWTGTFNPRPVGQAELLHIYQQAF